MTTKLRPGTIVPLQHTKKARERILVGISWDEREDKIGLIDRVRGTDSQHDLDISCFIFNRDGALIDYVGAEAQESMDQTEKIYHSGDDMTGAGDGDDEFINAELGELPTSIADLIFVVEMRSDHVFGDVSCPQARLADGMTNNNLLETNFGMEDGMDDRAFIFCRVTRDPSSETGWGLHHIGEYPDIDQIQDWGDYLKQYVR